jgi:FAD/FMN-containing dehydrogenase
VKACRSLGVDFVVSGGRHSTSGASSIENGAVIDLRLMNKVAVDPEANTVMAEGGALWSHVDEESAKYNLCAVGGRLLIVHLSCRI